MSLLKPYRRVSLCAIIAAATGLLLSGPSVVGAQQQKPLRVSLLQLVATPERYEGKQVSVVGFLVFGFEGDWLFLHKEDYENAIDSNAVRVDRTNDMSHEVEKLHRNYVYIVGVFRQKASPPGVSSEGRIMDVQKCELWSQPDHPRAQRFREIQRK